MTRPGRDRRALMAGLLGTAGIGLLPDLAPRLAAQAPGRPAGSTYTGKAFTFNEVLPGIFHAVGTGALAVGCNGSVVVNDDHVLLVDTHMTPAGAWALRDELRAVTPKPVRVVVNSHWHWDHAHGNQIYGPDVTIIGHEYTRAKLVAGDSTRGRSWDMFIGGLPGRIDDLTSQIAKAGAGDRPKLETQRAVLTTQREGIATIAVRPPTVTLSDHLTLHDGGREIRLLFLGRGHTGGDVVVFLPKERVVITADLLIEGTSYIGDAFIEEWLTTLDRLRALDYDVTLPGHGAVFRGKSKIDHFQAYLRDFRQQAAAFHKAGVPATEAAAKFDMRTHAPQYPAITAPGVLWHGVARAYEEFEGTAR